MGLLHATWVPIKVRFSINYRDIELDYASDIDEFGPKHRREMFSES